MAVGFEMAVVAAIIIGGLILYPAGIMVIDYMSDMYNMFCVGHGVGNQQYGDGFRIIQFAWQFEPYLAVFGATGWGIKAAYDRRAMGG